MGYVFRGTNRDIEPEPTPEPPKQFDPSMCGSVAGFKRHRKHGNEACRPCKDAINTYHRENRKLRKLGLTRKAAPFSDELCGTMAGYSRHARKDVPYCDPCRAARRAYREEYNYRQNVA